MGRAALGHRKHVAGRLPPTGNAPVLHGLRLASMRRFDATIRRGHGELRSAGNYLTVAPFRYLASRPGGGAYEAAAAALASTPGGGGSVLGLGEGHLI